MNIADEIENWLREGAPAPPSTPADADMAVEHPPVQQGTCDAHSGLWFRRCFRCDFAQVAAVPGFPGCWHHCRRDGRMVHVVWWRWGAP